MASNKLVISRAWQLSTASCLCQDTTAPKSADRCAFPTSMRGHTASLLHQCCQASRECENTTAVVRCRDQEFAILRRFGTHGRTRQPRQACEGALEGAVTWRQFLTNIDREMHAHGSYICTNTPLQQIDYEFSKKKVISLGSPHQRAAYVLLGRVKGCEAKPKRLPRKQRRQAGRLRQSCQLRQS